jgi:hypothetical protein
LALPQPAQAAKYVECAVFQNTQAEGGQVLINVVSLFTEFKINIKKGNATWFHDNTARKRKLARSVGLGDLSVRASVPYDAIKAKLMGEEVDNSLHNAGRCVALLIRIVQHRDSDISSSILFIFIISQRQEN